MIAWIDLYSGSHRLICPQCARTERDKTLGVTIDSGAGVAHCFRCNYTETWRSATFRRQHEKPALRAVETRQHDTLSDHGRELWNAAVPLPATVGEAYLLHRACALPPADGDLRCHPSLRHPSGYVGPALVALVTDAITREPLTLHRTWIAPDGSKANVKPARMLLGGHRKQGGCIRLWPDDLVTHGLAIAEGIETALSVARHYRPVWSCIDAGNLAALPVLSGIETLVIAADNDAAGIKAATGCGDRWAAAGVDVRIVAPQTERADWNDTEAAA